jgi:hypothetical protein
MLVTSNGKVRRSQAEWQAICERFAKSGLGPQEFCQRDCWTEVGARYVGIIQSLLATCRLQGVDPYVYFVDVLQRIATHPAFEVHLLTPRLWKQCFAANPSRSDIDRLRH